MNDWRSYGAGTTQSRTLWQRINVMQIMRQLSHDAHIIHFLFCSYDMRQAGSRALYNFPVNDTLLTLLLK